jgi:ribonucleotide reductase beta subunit family protein with ferritin-like domain
MELSMKTLLLISCKMLRFQKYVVSTDFQVAIENIHSEMYSLLIDTFIKDNDEKDKMFNAIDTLDCVKNESNLGFKMDR